MSIFARLWFEHICDHYVFGYLASGSHNSVHFKKISRLRPSIRAKTSHFKWEHTVNYALYFTVNYALYFTVNYTLNFNVSLL